jgi:hypothetical protein
VALDGDGAQRVERQQVELPGVLEEIAFDELRRADGLGAENEVPPGRILLVCRRLGAP